MKRRDFIAKGSMAAVATAMIPSFISCSGESDAKKVEEIDSSATQTPELVFTPFVLPELPFAHNALEPFIDTQTMEIHHGKHHAGYVTKLNTALENHPLKGKELTAIFAELKDEDGDIGVRNNGGGHYNHSLFWNILAPKATELPTGKLAEAIKTDLTSFEKFKETFSNAAATQFGSGWAWLCVDKEGKLFVTSTPNQDNPLMTNLVEKTGTPILGIDVWEHAYYLHYQNKRKEYIGNFFKIINWDKVSANYEAALA